MKKEFERSTTVVKMATCIYSSLNFVHVKCVDVRRRAATHDTARLRNATHRVRRERIFTLLYSSLFTVDGSNDTIQLNKENQ